MPCPVAGVGESTRPKVRPPKKETFTGPPRSTTKVAVFGAACTSIACASQPKLSRSESTSRGWLLKKSKSTDCLPPRRKAMAVPPYKTKCGGRPDSSGHSASCGGGRTSRCGWYASLMQDNALVVELQAVRDDHASKSTSANRARLAMLLRARAETPHGRAEPASCSNPPMCPTA